MFLFDLLFGRSKKQEEAAPVSATKVMPGIKPAPAVGLAYDPNLIARFKDDHALLVEIYQSIADARTAGNLLRVQERLNQFRIVLQDHLLKENVRLYVYLEHQTKNDPARYETIHGFRREMDGIGRVVVDFLGKYKDIGSKPELSAEFATDLAAIGGALTARIAREEGTLYPMYA